MHILSLCVAIHNTRIKIYNSSLHQAADCWLLDSYQYEEEEEESGVKLYANMF